MDELPQEIDAAFIGYEPGFDVTWTEKREPWWEQFGPEDGISGLHFPDHGVMYMDNRQVTHHNNQWVWIKHRGEVHSPVLPWAAGVDHNGDWHVEVGESKGGLQRELMKAGAEDVEILMGPGIDKAAVLDIGYACRLAAVPPTATFRFPYRGDSVRSADPNYSPHFEVWLGDLYDVLRRAPEGLPSPMVDRTTTTFRG